MGGENFNEGKGERHLNKWEEHGVVIGLDKGESNSGVPYLNVTLEVHGKKYIEKIPFVAYGRLADAISASASKGDTVHAFGRVRSKEKEGRIGITLVCERFDVIKL